jgi:hypothetical protein
MTDRLAERLAREAKERVIFADEPAEVVILAALRAFQAEAVRVAREFVWENSAPPIRPDERNVRDAIAAAIEAL